MNAAQVSGPGEGVARQGLDSSQIRADLQPALDSGWSALMDGALQPDELEQLLASSPDSDVFERWETYRLVGDALRGETPLLGASPGPEFLRGVQARLRDEGSVVPMPQQPAPAYTPASIVVHLPPKAANDASFRWKMIAMAASVSAVMAVSWSLLGAGVTGGGTPQAGPVIAGVSPEPVVRVAVPQSEGPVVVETPQGRLIRDARLEALMAEHRQYGGMSALQMPAGFLRNATYDAPER